MRTIADYDHGRENNYHLLRFFAASLVIVGHSYYLSTSGGREPLKMLTEYKHFGEVGVQIFFVISGFLVTKSFLSRRDLLGYLEARVLRIFPALAVAVLFGVLIIGPWATTLPLADYFSDKQVVRHLINNTILTTPEWGLPGVFATNPWRHAVNGSLWSLFTEVRLYLLVGVLGVAGLLAPRRLFNTALVLVAVLCVYFPGMARVLGQALNGIHWGVSSAFLFGAFCYINRDVVPIHGMVAAIFAAGAVLLHGTPFFPVAFDLTVSYGTLFFAYTPSLNWIRRWNNTGDYSYGMYLYAFPVQQMMAFLIPTVTALPMMAFTFGGTLPLAVLSWHVIEKPALAAKGSLVAGLTRGCRVAFDAMTTWKTPVTNRSTAEPSEHDLKKR